MGDHHGKNVGLRAGTVTGSSRGVGNRRGTTTAPPDNLAAIMRDATIIVDDGICPAVTLHMREVPQLVEHVRVADPSNQERGDLGESSDGPS